MGEAPQERIYPEIDVKNETQLMERAVQRYRQTTTPSERTMVDIISQNIAGILDTGGAAVAAGAAFANMPASIAYDTTIRQIGLMLNDYLPEGAVRSVIDSTRYIVDMIVNFDRAREDMVRLGERVVSDNLYAPIQQMANKGLNVLFSQASRQLKYYGEVAPLTIEQIVERIQNNAMHFSITLLSMTVMALMNPAGFIAANAETRRVRGPGGGLRSNPTQRQILNVASFT